MIVFNSGKNRDYFRRYEFNKMELEVIEEVHLLDVIIRKDLSRGPNRVYMVQKAKKKLWYLRRLSKLGASTDDLLGVYTKVRCHLEFAVAWYPSLTGKNRLKIDRVQK